MQKILENIFKKIVYYVVPILIILVLALSYFDKIAGREIHWLFANRWLNLLLVVLFIKPLVIIPPKYSKINLFTVRECITYFVIERTKKPILQYLFDWIKNLIFSLSFYLMKFRKELWILVFRFIFLHFALLEMSRYARWLTFTSNISQPFIIAWLVWLLMLFIGFVTSNNFSLRLFKTNRKPIQKTAYIAFVSAILHLVLLNPSEYRTYIIWLIIYFVLKYFELKPKKITSNPVQTPQETTTKPVITTEKKESDSIPLSAKIIQKNQLNPTIIELSFQVNQKLIVIPWQRVLIPFRDSQWDFTRAYSISEHEVQDEKSVITILVKIRENGRATKILDESSIGDIFAIKWVYWHFKLIQNANPKVFIATGTWLAPIYNMISNDDSSEKLLLFSVSYKQDLFYEDKVKKIKNLTYKYYISREDIEWYEFGRIDLSKFDFKPETEFYICGSPEMVKSQKEFLVSKWFSKIYVEQY